MKFSLIFPIAVLMLFCLFSCNKGSNPGPYNHLPNDAASLILGKWNLQKESLVQYVDGVKKIDTTFNTSSNNIAAVEFNKNDTYSSESAYISNSLSSGASNMETTGTYSIVGQVFIVNGAIAGFDTSLSFLNFSEVPVITPVSHSIQINQLTASSLNLHTEYVYTYTLNNVSKTNKTETDYYYTK